MVDVIESGVSVLEAEDQIKASGDLPLWPDFRIVTALPAEVGPEFAHLPPVVESLVIGFQREGKKYVGGLVLCEPWGGMGEGQREKMIEIFQFQVQRPEYWREV